jgi:hypothetical protein
MKRKKERKEKKECMLKVNFQDIFSDPVFRVVAFVLIVGVIFFLIGGAVWGTKQFFVAKIGAEEYGHVLIVQSKLSEIKEDTRFFNETLRHLEQNNLLTEDDRT